MWMNPSLIFITNGDPAATIILSKIVLALKTIYQDFFDDTSSTDSLASQIKQHEMQESYGLSFVREASKTNLNILDKEEDLRFFAQQLKLRAGLTAANFDVEYFITHMRPHLTYIKNYSGNKANKALLSALAESGMNYQCISSSSQVNINSLYAFYNKNFLRPKLADYFLRFSEGVIGRVQQEHTNTLYEDIYNQLNVDATTKFCFFYLYSGSVPEHIKRLPNVTTIDLKRKSEKFIIDTVCSKIWEKGKVLRQQAKDEKEKIERVKKEKEKIAKANKSATELTKAEFKVDYLEDYHAQYFKNPGSFMLWNMEKLTMAEILEHGKDPNTRTARVLSPYKKG